MGDTDSDTGGDTCEEDCRNASLFALNIFRQLNMWMERFWFLLPKAPVACSFLKIGRLFNLYFGEKLRWKSIYASLGILRL